MAGSQGGGPEAAPREGGRQVLEDTWARRLSSRKGCGQPGEQEHPSLSEDLNGETQRRQTRSKGENLAS